MTLEDDVARMTSLGSQLAPLDVDGAAAARIAGSARAQLGHHPPLGRLIEPVLAVVLVVSYVGWAILKAKEALGG